MMFDAAIINGTLADPECLTRENKNIGISGGRIAAISRERLSAKEYFDAAGHVSRINPGSLKEWPITGQLPLFEALGGVTADIGVSLAESMLMSPVKSVSGIMFQGDTPFENCQLCPKANCPNRRAPYVA